MAGLEIEGVAAAGPPLPGVVVGEVKSVTKHPDAEKLNVCVVSTGIRRVSDRVRRAECSRRHEGAACDDWREAAEWDGDQARKLRGVESSGMLCSARELGINEEASGLYDLPADFVARGRRSSARSGSMTRFSK